MVSVNNGIISYEATELAVDAEMDWTRMNTHGAPHDL